MGKWAGISYKESTAVCNHTQEIPKIGDFLLESKQPSPSSQIHDQALGITGWLCLLPTGGRPTIKLHFLLFSSLTYCDTQGRGRDK